MQFPRVLTSTFLWLLPAAALARGPVPPTWIGTIGSFLPEGGSLNQPTGVAVDSAGQVYITNFGRHRIEMYDASGSHLGSWSGGWINPHGIHIDDAGRIYVTDYGYDRIAIYTSGRTFLDQVGPSGPGYGTLFNPSDVDLDEDGNLYVADDENNRIVVFDSSREYLRQWGGSGSGDGQFNRVSAIDVDESGDVWVADSFNRRVQKFDSEGNHLATIGSFGTDPGQFTVPSGIHAGSDGRVYIADWGAATNWINVFDLAGNFVLRWGRPGTVPAGEEADGPRGVWVDDGTGEVYVVASRGREVQKYGYPVPVSPLSWGAIKGRFR